ncbi:hypothetical protein JTE90_002918 [Oedothorax gibbosus]|uniref:Uncharacterized protein n=1 Tax=Oedothorax gibbosus TaxID=931172 RepID=A0AAV6TKN8_9ARAC|nr:hypothetical protein JTE90_002918 [Oedothorax gibbosus]
MLSDIIKQSSGWDTKALAEIFSNKKFLRSVDGDKEKYLADLISRDYEKTNITLPRKIIPNDVTLSALRYIYKKEPATLPILLRYFTHSNLLAEAKDDLDKVNQKLQGVMDKELKDLQDKKAKLQANETDLNDKKIQGKEAKALAYDIQKINAEITEASSEIEKIKLHKEEIKNLLNGDKVSKSYPPQYFSILNNGLIEIMEKKLTAYVKDNTDIGETYSSLNSRAKKIIRVRNVKSVLLFSSALACGIACMPFIAVFCQSCAGPNEFHYSMFYFFIHYSLPVLFPIAATLLALVGAVYLEQRHYEQSFAKEMKTL